MRSSLGPLSRPVRVLVAVTAVLVVTAALVGARYQNLREPLRPIFAPTFNEAEFSSPAEAIRAFDAHLQRRSGLTTVEHFLPGQTGDLWISLLVLLVVGVDYRRPLLRGRNLDLVVAQLIGWLLIGSIDMFLAAEHFGSAPYRGLVRMMFASVVMVTLFLALRQHSPFGKAGRQGGGVMVGRGLAATVMLSVVWGAGIVAGAPQQGQSAPGYVPDLRGIGRSADSELAGLVARYALDRQALLRRYDLDLSPDHRRALRAFYEEWRSKVATLPFDTLSVEGRIDAVLLDLRLGWELQLLDRSEEWIRETTSIVPFAGTITTLHDARRRLESVNPEAAAATLSTLAREVDRTRTAVEAGLATGEPRATAPQGPAPLTTSRIVALRAAQQIDELADALASWHEHYSGYDPLFTWWTAAPFKKADEALKTYRELLRRKVLGTGPDGDEPIVGNPIGRDALVADLRFEVIPYIPEDLLAIAEREFAWCEAELRKAARDMGLGDDWKAALEKVKTLYVEPGKQPDLVRDLAREAEDYVERNGLITVPAVAREVWRLQMMSPERQRVNPFFLGGEVITVSFPTDTMSHEDKLMSLRGNNVHFARATVFHELIPGHHLQGYMTARYNAHRRAFSTPFWGEGWALYWEMLLWDRGYQRSPEDRVGMLFWRAHRAARIIFSLRFHMGTMTPQECIDFLVDRVGHERANATAEVRRSFNGSYPPLYQLAYMIGGLQFMALHRELVGSDRMTDREFHDAIITGGSMPVEMVRVRLLKQSLARDHQPSWRFTDALRRAPAGR